MMDVGEPSRGSVPSEPLAGGHSQVVAMSQGQRDIASKSIFLLPFPHPSFPTSSTNLLRFS